MFQSRRRRVFAGVMMGAALTVMGTTGCSSSRAAKVDESWLARVPEGQLDDVREAQTQRRMAQDAVTRSDVALNDARRELEVAKRNEDAAKSRKEAHDAALKAAKATGQSDNINEAQAELQDADLSLTAAQAQVQYREQNVKTMEAQKELRESELAMVEAKLNQAEYEALKANDDVRAQDLSEADFTAATAEAQRKVEEAQRKVQTQERQEQQARANWQRLRDQVRGYGGSGTEFEQRNTP
ncbi:hypothetical protein [Myxococcus sp. Y35]|uniref:hypothetical protein n=1 Tax=Pseudomyxococcus flavus TaxID=3115648 RepID=UPI003CE9589A